MQKILITTMRSFKELKLKVTGLDISKETLSFSEGIKIKICNIQKQKIPFNDNSFDIIFSKSLIEHLDDPSNFLKESRRVLKKNVHLFSHFYKKKIRVKKPT